MERRRCRGAEDELASSLADRTPAAALVSLDGLP
jgi:hypothetical protein